MRLRVAGQICPSREVLAQQAVRVLIAAALPWAAGIAEVDCTPVATAKVLWSAISLPRSHVNDRRSSTGNLRTCLLSAPTTVAVSLLGTVISIAKREWRSTFGLAHLPRRTQVRHQLLLQRAARLHKQTAIDRFVRHLHVFVSREFPLEPPGDLLWRPLEPISARLITDTTAAAREALGGGFDDAWAAGANMDLAAAVDLAVRKLGG